MIGERLHATLPGCGATQRRMRAEDDRDLVADVLASGSEASFRALYRRHTPALYGLALRLLGGAADADDAVQEAWIRAAGRFAAFRWESSLRTWLSGILVNRCREIRRQRGQNEEVHRSGVMLTDEALRVDLERAIASLPDGYRDVVVLHDVEGHTHEDIGRMLGIEAGTSKSQLSRGRRALRQLLGHGPPTARPN